MLLGKSKKQVLLKYICTYKTESVQVVLNVIVKNSIVNMFAGMFAVVHIEELRNVFFICSLISQMEIFLPKA